MIMLGIQPDNGFNYMVHQRSISVENRNTKKGVEYILIDTVNSANIYARGHCCIWLLKTNTASHAPINDLDLMVTYILFIVDINLPLTHY